MEDTMYFNFDIAEEHGLNAAVLLSFFEGMFQVQESGDDRFIYDVDGWYLRITYAEICDHLPFFTAKQVRDTMKKLIEAGEIESKKSNPQKWDHTKMYRITHAPFHPGTKDPF